MNSLKLLLFCIVVVSCQARKHYHGFKVLRLIPKNKLQLKFLQWLWRAREYELDFWVPPTKIERPVDLLIGPTFFNDLNNDLQSKNISYNIQTTDLEQAIQNEKKRVRRKQKIESEEKSEESAEIHFDLNRYHQYDEIEAYLLGLESKFPTRVMVEVIGKTHENRALYVVNIKGAPSEAKKPGFWLDGGIHAREWISPATVLQILDKLITSYDTDENIKTLVDSIDWFIMPVVNPDGFEFTHEEDRMWRKNRSPEVCGGTEDFSQNCCPGTDLNRNFEWQWATTGSSENPCEDIYHGSSPASEPETQAVQNFVLSKKEQIKAFISVHSYSQLWLLPFGHQPNSYPDDYLSHILPVSQDAANELQKVHSKPFEVGTAADILYSASGNSMDWAKGVAGIGYSATLELRPTAGIFSDGFLLDESEIKGSSEETWAGLEVVALEVVLLGSEASTKSPVFTETTDFMQILSSSSSSVEVCENWSPFCSWWKLFKEDSCKRRRVQKACPKTCGLC